MSDRLKIRSEPRPVIPVWSVVKIDTKQTKGLMVMVYQSKEICNRHYDGSVDIDIEYAGLDAGGKVQVFMDWNVTERCGRISLQQSILLPDK